MTWVAAAGQLGNAFPMPRGGGWGGKPGPMFSNPMGYPAAPTGGTLASLIKQTGLPMMADGGDVVPGQPVIVGEQGPEVIVPATPGTVIPNPQTVAQSPYQRYMATVGGGVNDTLGTLRAYLAKTLMPKSAQGQPAGVPMPAPVVHERIPITAPVAATVAPGNAITQALGITNADILAPNAQKAYADANNHIALGGGALTPAQLAEAEAQKANQVPVTGLKGAASTTDAAIEERAKKLMKNAPSRFPTLKEAEAFIRANPQ